MSRSVRLASIALAVVLGAPAAHAQFTPGLTMPRRRAPYVDPALARAAQKRDTVPRVRLSDLKAWVDSVTQYAPTTLRAPGVAAPVSPTPAPVKAPAAAPPPPVAPPSTAPANPPAAPAKTKPPASTPR